GEELVELLEVELNPLIRLTVLSVEVRTTEGLDLVAQVQIGAFVSTEVESDPRDSTEGMHPVRRGRDHRLVTREQLPFLLILLEDVARPRITLPDRPDMELRATWLIGRWRVHLALV